MLVDPELAVVDQFPANAFGAPDGAGNAAICAELRNFRQRFKPVDCRKQLEIRAGNRAAWRRRIAELRHC